MHRRVSRCAHRSTTFFHSSRTCPRTTPRPRRATGRVVRLPETCERRSDGDVRCVMGRDLDVDDSAPPREPTSVRVPGDVLVHLRRARDHVDRHFTEPIELDVVAAVAGLSKFHFHRLFRRVRSDAGALPDSATSRAGTGPASSHEPHRDRGLLRGRVLEPRIVQCPFLGAGRRVAERVPTSLRHLGAPRIPGCFVFMWGLAERRSALGRFRKRGEVVDVGRL